MICVLCCSPGNGKNVKTNGEVHTAMRCNRAIRIRRDEKTRSPALISWGSRASTALKLRVSLPSRARQDCTRGFIRNGAGARLCGVGTRWSKPDRSQTAARWLGPVVKTISPRDVLLLVCPRPATDRLVPALCVNNVACAAMPVGVGHGTRGPARFHARRTPFPALFGSFRGICAR